MICSAVAPGPYWTIPPDRFIVLHPRLTDLTPVMMQTLDTTNDHIKTESERYKTRTGRNPNHRSTRTTLDRTGATRDTLAKQLHKHEGD